MTRETLSESTGVALDDVVSKLREDVLAGRAQSVAEYASAIRDLAAALRDLDEDD